MSKEQSQEVINHTEANAEKPMVEQNNSAEVATQSQDNDLDKPDYGQLVQESKKYRKRAQESEAKLLKMQKKLDADRQKQMEEQNQWQQLAEERLEKLNKVEPIVEAYEVDIANQREMIFEELDKIDETLRESFKDAPLPQLRALSKTVINNSSVPNTSSTPARAINPNNKDWTKMTKEEKRKNWKDIMKGYTYKR